MKSNCESRNTVSQNNTGRKDQPGPEILPGNTSLTSLGIRFSTKMKDISVLSTLKNLRRLELFDCEALEDIRPVADLGDLTTLILDGCHSVRDISCLAACRNLKSLSLKNCMNLYDLRVLPEITNLVRLEVCECGTLYKKRDGFVWGDEGDGNIEIERRSAGAASSVENIAGLGNLRHLTLGGFRCMKNIDLLGGLSQLESLELDDLRSLSDLSGLVSLRRLNTLSIRSNNVLSGLNSLYCLESLRTLSLQDCKALLETGNLISLKKLSLSFLPSFMNTAGLSRHKNLRVFRIEHCGQVTDLDVLAGLRHLTAIKIAHCPVKSTRLLLECPSLKNMEIDLSLF